MVKTIDLFDTSILNNKGLAQHPMFKIFTNNRSMSQVIAYKSLLTSWTLGMDDKDNKMALEFQTSFYSVFWEIFLFAYFNTIDGISIVQKYQVPDFVIHDDVFDSNIFIEAVVSNAVNGRCLNLGQKERSGQNLNIGNHLITHYDKLRPLHLQGPSDFYNDTIIRYSNSIISKCDAYVNQYSKKYWVDEYSPYCIALFDRTHESSSGHNIYLMIHLLYGLFLEADGPFVNVVDSLSILKNNGSIVATNLFMNRDLDFLSGIFFSVNCATIGKLDSLIASNSDVFEYIDTSVSTLWSNGLFYFDDAYMECNYISSANKELMSDGLFYFVNPFAKNPINKDLLGRLNVTVLEYNTIEHQLLITEPTVNGIPRSILWSRFSGSHNISDYIHNMYRHLQFEYNSYKK